MTNAKLGEKRECASCGAKFYDLGKTPPVCPKCGTVYQPPKEISKGRKVAAPKAPPKPAKKLAKKSPLLEGAEDIDLEGFGVIEVDDEVAGDLEEIDDIEEDVESLSELEDREIADDRVNSDDVDDDLLIDEIEGDVTLVDPVIEEEESDEDEE